jgi:hypothetical protein
MAHGRVMDHYGRLFPNSHLRDLALEGGLLQILIKGGRL